MAPKITIIKRQKVVVPVDIALADTLRAWDGEIKVRYTRGEDIPEFDPVEECLVGGYFKIQQLFKAANIDIYSDDPPDDGEEIPSD